MKIHSHIGLTPTKTGEGAGGGVLAMLNVWYFN